MAVPYVPAAACPSNAVDAENYGPGCAVGVTTLETAATSPRYQRAVAAAFETWTSTLADRFTERGVGAGRAVALADAVVAGLEGATILARARRDTTPLRNTARMLAISVKAATSGATD